MKNNLYFILSSVIFVSIITINSTFFIVNEGYKAILIQFGNIINEKPIGPGLHVKLPFIQNVFRIDSRLHHIATHSKEIIASDQKRLIVSYYIKYKIIDQIKFYKSSKSIKSLENKIKPIIESSIRENIGMVSLVDLLNNKRSQVMQSVKLEVNDIAIDLGVEIIDVRIKKTDLPSENSEAIFSRMQTEREKEAKEIRAKGLEEAKIIKSTADKEVEIIIAEAKEKENIIKGHGEAKSIEIYNKASLKDPDFFLFYKKINSYENIANSGENKFFININENDFLKMVTNGIEK